MVMSVALGDRYVYSVFESDRMSIADMEEQGKENEGLRLLMGKQSGVFDDLHGLTDSTAEAKLTVLAFSRVWGTARCSLKW